MFTLFDQSNSIGDTMDTQIQWRTVRAANCVKRFTREDGSVKDFKVFLTEMTNKTLEQRVAEMNAQGKSKGYEIIVIEYTTTQVA